MIYIKGLLLSGNPLKSVPEEFRIILILNSPTSNYCSLLLEVRMNHSIIIVFISEKLLIRVFLDESAFLLLFLLSRITWWRGAWRARRGGTVTWTRMMSPIKWCYQIIIWILPLVLVVPMFIMMMRRFFTFSISATFFMAASVPISIMAPTSAIPTTTSSTDVPIPSTFVFRTRRSLARWFWYVLDLFNRINWLLFIFRYCLRRCHVSILLTNTIGYSWFYILFRYKLRGNSSILDVHRHWLVFRGWSSSNIHTGILKCVFVRISPTIFS